MHGIGRHCGVRSAFTSRISAWCDGGGLVLHGAAAAAQDEKKTFTILHTPTDPMASAPRSSRSL